MVRHHTTLQHIITMQRHQTVKLTTKDRQLIAALHDLPLTARPFLAIGEKLSESERWVLGKLRRWRRNGLMRKLAAIGRHRRMGYRANAMVCWQVAPAVTDALAARFARLDCVSHCYRRRTRRGWEYSLYTMVHAASRTGLGEAIEEMTRLAGGADKLVLPSRKEYKKTSPHYFQEVLGPGS